MNTVLEFHQKKQNGQRISLTTCYDYWSACILRDTPIDAVLVGDSASMVMHGYPSTVHASVEMMVWHVAAVARALPSMFIIADLPFLAHRKGTEFLMQSVDRLMKAGAHAVKAEGGSEVIAEIQHIIQSGVPVMGHLGLTPQSVNMLGGHKLQATRPEAADKLVNDALLLEDAGVFALVLEMVPAGLAQQVTQKLKIPVIGIGAGPHTDGQVLVLQDLLGMSKDFSPKFLRKYLNGYELIKEALIRFDADVKNGNFPSEKESYV
ncbi:MAG: 3-methyl-2-oxobutanoate hydroxymethyltransferase [Cyclobacteriaceae bacterium]|nr:3-methyl-2-oxobutanoate hydroxymethyltransferase [Cyclobacteriaceae bacterium]MCX7636999.1 3-methyl-2-oxobutanoate hydroxymethyltransferase [Cyclobacteriaceae bacterium]MDW8330122.1 3-methyl-2-oxobutanoate hydroxymethyltransferase [Cyclobacteriaceae bacterium]